MSNNWGIGNYVKVQGVAHDFKMLSYHFAVNGYVELVLEAPDGSRVFLKRRKSQVHALKTVPADNETNILRLANPEFGRR